MPKEEFIMPPRPKEQPETEFEKRFELRKQYQEQIQTLAETGLVELLPNGDMGFYDINHEQRRIPTYEEILERVEAKKELLEKKREQGFTKLLLVPFGMRLREIADRAHDLILKKHKEGKLKGTNGDKLELNEAEPVYMSEEYQGGDADISGDLVYDVEQFDPENHGGKTKQEELKGAKLIGWDMMFIEDLPDLPAEGKGKVVGGRKQLEANQSPNQYLKKLKEDEQYAGEQGMTPEAELTYFIYNLQRKNQVIDDYQGSGKANWNLGGYLKTSGGVCDSCWERSGRQMFLNWHDPDARYDSGAVRVGVRF